MDLFRRFTVERFNRLCIILAALWLIVTIPLGLVLRPTWNDFSQFYVGGFLARHGQWKALYPVPTPGCLDNAGLITHSYGKPGWLAVCRAHGIADYTHFILPPPSALLFTPLSMLSYQHAFWTWIAILIASVWGVAVISGRIYRQVSGAPSRIEGLLALAIAISPMTARSIRIANVSPPIAFMISGALLALLSPQDNSRQTSLAGALSLFLGATMKYATLILAPLLIALRRWRMIVYFAIAGIALFAVTLVVAGAAPFHEFIGRIAPTLSRPSAYFGNQSLPGLLARTIGRPLPPLVETTLILLRFFTLGNILLVIFLLDRRHWNKSVNVVAAAALLLAWLLIFSPIAWEHWPIFLCPIWGWLAWEARNPGLHRIVALAAILLMYVPAGILQVNGIATLPILIPEPFNSTQLLGFMLVAILAFARLSEANALKQTSAQPDIPENEEPEIDRLASRRQK